MHPLTTCVLSFFLVFKEDFVKPLFLKIICFVSKFNFFLYQFIGLKKIIKNKIRKRKYLGRHIF